MPVEEITPLLEIEHEIKKTELDDEVINEQDESRWFAHQLSVVESLPWYKRPSVAVLAMLYFLIATCIVISQASEYQLIVAQACRSVAEENAEGGICESAAAQEAFSKYQIATVISSGITTTIVAGRLGQYSDVYGRKPIMGISFLCFMLGLAWKTYFLLPGKPFNVTALVLGEIITVSGGSAPTLISVAHSYIADIEKAENRTRSMGIVGAFMAAGMSFGPVAGNIVLSVSSKNTVMKLACVCGMSVVMYIFLFFPESRSKIARRRSRTQMRANIPLDATRTERIMNTLNVLKPLKKLLLPKSKARYVVLNLVLIRVITTCTSSALNVLLNYATFKLGMTAIELGNANFIGGATGFVSLMVLAPMIIEYLKTVFVVNPNAMDNLDYTLIFGATVLNISVGFIEYFLTSLRGAYSILVIMGLSLIGSSALDSTLIKYFDVRQSGEIYGGLAILTNFVGFISNPLYLYIYSHTLNWWDKFIFFSNASILTIEFFVLLVLRVLMVNGDIDDLQSVVDEEI